MYYNSLNNYLKQKFGCKVYKLALSGGMSCPNRDGTIGKNGCIFCSSFGSGDFAEPCANNIYEQIENAKQRVSKKIENGKYIAYFQSFSNTYADINYLEKLFLKAISHPDIAVLSIATRPDCLPFEVIELLKKLNEIKPVWIELGLQTIHESSAEFLRRGYCLSVYDDAVLRLKNAGITVITHMIIGIPFETEEMIYKTAQHIGDIGSDGIKIHLLHVLKNTDLEKYYYQKGIDLPSLERYTDLLIGCIRRLPSNVVIHRITGDGAKKNLIAPLWSANKKKVLNYIIKCFNERNLQQGDLYNHNT